jgi:hypothetical protein
VVDESAPLCPFSVSGANPGLDSTLHVVMCLVVSSTLRESQISLSLMTWILLRSAGQEFCKCPSLDLSGVFSDGD